MNVRCYFPITLTPFTKKLPVLAIAALLAVFAPAGIGHAGDPIQDALTGCAKELKSFCSTVNPGEGRLVACVQAHEDQLSRQCSSAVNRAGFLMKSLGLAIEYVAVQCQADAVKHCPDVKIGGGRVINCLAKHKANISKECNTALQDVGAKR